MKDYLNSVLNSCNRICEICSNIVEEVNDGDERSALILSSSEALFNLQIMMRAYASMYPSAFDSKLMQKKLKKFLSASPQRWLRLKHFRRCNPGKVYYDDLPF